MTTEEDKPLDISEAVDAAIQAIVKKMNDLETKGTIGDLIRLLQLRDELTVEPKGFIRAGWVDEWNEE